MKKRLSLFLAATMILFTLAMPVSAAGFEAADVTGVKLSSSMPFTKEVTSSEAAALTAVRDFLASAGAAGEIPSGSAGIAALAVTAGSGTTTYRLLSAEGNYYLAAMGGDCRPVDYAAFETMVRAIDGMYDSVTPLQNRAKTLFYPYAPVPGAVYDGKELAVFENRYAFQRINGKFAYRTTAFDMAVPSYSSADGKLIAPEFYLAPVSVTYTVYQGGEPAPVLTGNSTLALGQTLAGGVYTVLVQANYSGEHYRGPVTYQYELSVGSGVQASSPASGALRFAVEADHAAPGEMIVLRVSGADAAKSAATAVTDVEYKPVFFRQANGDQIALVPVSVYTAPGAHSVTITCGARSETLGYTVKDKQFEVQQLTVAASTAEETINSQKANNEYEAVVAPLRFIADDTQRWSGRFILPTSDEKVTSPFGIIRYVNGGSNATRHNALDLAVPLGTPVKAAGGGRVLYAGFLQLTGNTIIIEHGYGLKSWYYHMDSLAVETGETVAQGQAIGAVGSTGFSTGAHMHFGMSVNNVFVNPYTLINTDLAE